MAKKRKYNHKKQTRPKYVKKTSKLEKGVKVFVACFLLAAMIIPMAAAAIMESPIDVQQSNNSDDSFREQLKAMGLTDEQIASAMGEATPADASSLSDELLETDEHSTIQADSDDGNGEAGVVSGNISNQDDVNSTTNVIEPVETESYNPGFYVGAKVKVPKDVKIGDKIELDTSYDEYNSMEYPSGYDASEELETTEETSAAQVKE